MKLSPFKKDFYSYLITKMYHKCLNFLFLPYFLSLNAINNSMFLSKRLTINKRILSEKAYQIEPKSENLSKLEAA